MMFIFDLPGSCNTIFVLGKYLNVRMDERWGCSVDETRDGDHEASKSLRHSLSRPGVGQPGPCPGISGSMLGEGRSH